MLAATSKVFVLHKKVKKLAVTSKAPKEPQLYFERPIVTARLYSAKGPSGWLETFQRRKLDLELERFLGAAPVELAVETFILQRETAGDGKGIDWHTVIGFLARLVEVSPFAVPPEVALAFWGQVELALRTRGAN